ncbi:TPA: fimbrial protein [Klebsiella variicola subsp. variicola]|uniref:fimbrial protein n=1 Tax=Klebsiella TaxID=570 RepID=UPI000D6F4AC0|nr:fimbrial protein [Klebsiella variicola]MBD0721933.1 fimbrial protein [Klebsiella variicola]HED1713365.1 fimbrial protein [Klebsiella variicola subsp. variicola]
MKNLNLKTSLCALAVPLILLSGSAAAANASADITITALVTPVCYISASASTVDLGEIPASYTSLPSGTLMSGVSTKNVTLTPECHGASGATITLTTASAATDSGCLESTPAAGGNPMQFCVYDGGDTTTRLDMNTTPALTLEDSALDTPRTLTVAAAGNNGSVAANGEHMADLIATIEAQ